MGDIVNLRQVRKRKARRERELDAGQNRAKYGRTGAERRRDTAEETRLKRHLDAHRREDGSED